MLESWVLIPLPTKVLAAMYWKTTVMNQEFVKLDKFDGWISITGKIDVVLHTTLNIPYIQDFDLPSLLAPTPEDNDKKKEGQKNKKGRSCAEDIFSRICLIIIWSLNICQFS